MKKNILNNLIVLSIAIAVLSSCKAKKAIVVAPPVVKTDTVNVKKTENLQLLKNKSAVFNTLSLKGKAQVTMNGSTNNVSIVVRMLKGKKIWVSMSSAFVGEVARAMLTPDSVLVMNKMQNVYLEKPFRYVHNFTNKQVDFNMLEDVFAGNAVRAFLNESSGLDRENGVWLLKGETKNLAYQILFNTLLKASEVNLNDVSAGQALKVVYGEYQEVNGALYPSTVQVSSESGNKKINLNLDFSKIEVDTPLDFNFTVPKRFQVIN